MNSKFMPTAMETLPLQDAMCEDRRLESKAKNQPRSETHVFQMPNIENGVSDIGDLWDCCRSQPAGQNLLNTSTFTSEMMQTSLIDKCDMRFRHVRSHDDKIQSLHIDGKMSLEFLLGRIKLEGQFAYDTSTTSKRSVEGILYNYLNEQYRIQLIPRIKPKFLNRDVETLLQQQILKATHVVGGIIIGAEVTAWIEVTDTSSGTKVSKDGKAGVQSAKGILKCLSSLSGNAEIKDSNETSITNTEVKLSVTARPAVKQTPTGLNEFLSFIRNLSDDLPNHVHFPDINAKMYGVPIRYILYPISQYVDMETEMLYRELTDACQSDFVGVIAKCNDLRQSGYMWKLILERNGQLRFLQDSKSKFSKKVDIYQKEIRDFAEVILSRSRKALSDYKSNECDIDKIESIVHDFYKSEARLAQEKAMSMADEGTKELQSAYFDETEESGVKRFTDRNDCDIWLGKMKPRLLLEIEPPCSEAIVKNFLSAAKHLAALDVDVAIAMPTISKGVCLTIKCSERNETRGENKLIKVLAVLNAVVVDGYSSIHTFYRILGSLCNIRIPLSRDDMSCLDKILSMFLRETLDQNLERDVRFVRSMCDLTTELSASFDRTVMCLPLGAPDTDLAVVKQFRSLAKHAAFSDCKWIFCNFEVNNYHESPLLLIFFKGEIAAVCLDNLDILILMNKLNSKKFDESALEDVLKLTPARFSNTLYPERAYYTLEIMSRINSGTRLSSSKINGFSGVSNEESLKHLMVVIRATLHNDIVELAAAVAALVTDAFPNLRSTLEKCGWSEMRKNFDSDHFKREGSAHHEIVNELKDWMKKDHSSFDAIVQQTQQHLVNLQNGDDSYFDEALRSIMSNDHCPGTVVAKLSKVKSSRQSLKAKCLEASNILNIDSLKEILEDGNRHIRALIKVLQKDNQGNLSLETQAGELACTYSKRSTTVKENSVLEDEITRFHRPYLPYHMLNALLPAKHGIALLRLYVALANLDSLDNSSSVAEIINTTYDVLNREDIKVLWKNEEWLFLVRHCLNNHNNKELNDSLSKWITKDFESCPVPADIVEIHQPFTAGRELGLVPENQTAKISDGVIGHENSFQAWGQLYHNALKSDGLLETVIDRFAQNLLDGKAIELVNGDSRKIPLAFFASVCSTVSRKQPGMRVFVMTLFELRMTQRSSLLSALFSCKCASSVDRHNIHVRSLFMKMILLDENVRKAYGYDAIIVLNTESLRSQEVITSYTKGRNDVSRDWLSTIFAISLSDLIVIDDVLCKEQTRGFKRVTGALDRLRQVSILPDLLISRNVNGGRMSSTPASGEIVDRTVRTQLDGVNSNGDAGAHCAQCVNNNKHYTEVTYLNVPCLINDGTDEIQSTNETIHEDITNLYQLLLNRDNSRARRYTFEYWSQLLCSYWNCLKEHHYWLCFREAKEFLELPYFGKQFADAKESLTRTFLIHRKKILKEVMTGILREHFLSEIWEQLETIPSHCPSKCRSCQKTISCRDKLYVDVKDTAWQDIIIVSFQNYRKSIFESMTRHLEMEIKELGERQSIAQGMSNHVRGELQKIHNDCPDGFFGDVNVKISEIWRQLLQTISTQSTCKHESSEKEQFAKIVDELYPKRDISVLMANLKSFRAVDTTDFGVADNIPEFVVDDPNKPLTMRKLIEIITECQAVVSELQPSTVGFRQISFNSLHIFTLKSEINRIVSKFLTSKRFDCLQAGVKFEKEIATQFNNHIVAIIKKFEAKFKVSIPDDLKHFLQICILKIFFDRVMVLQKKWNSNNIVLNILSLGETDYKEDMSTRLSCGFSSEAEGKLASKYLIMLIKTKTEKEVYEARVKSFLSIPWVANSETVRLHYLESLALQVAAGEKEIALEHFRNPQASITRWYKEAANHHRSKSEHKLFGSALDRCLQEIRAYKDYNDIDKLLRRYETFASSIYKYNRFPTKGDEFTSMLNSLESELEQYSRSDVFHEFPNMWENLEIRSRLGCTEECFRCGALCWSYLDHQEDEGELSKHFSCHQARGLATFSSDKNIKLLATPCSHVSGLGKVTGVITLLEYGSEISLASKRTFSWEEIESDHLDDWKFQKIIASKYDDLMRWLFQELHTDIANERQLGSPSESTLKEFGYLGLNLPSILAALRN